MENIPVIKIGIVAVSRDCFPESLAVNRRKALVAEYLKKFSAADIYECPICIVESEIHAQQALADVQKAGCNALCVYLGNFGPEISETMIADWFQGPTMFCAAAEETQNPFDEYISILVRIIDCDLFFCGEEIIKPLPVSFHVAVNPNSNHKVFGFQPRRIEQRSVKICNRGRVDLCRGRTQAFNFYDLILCFFAGKSQRRAGRVFDL